MISRLQANRKAASVHRLIGMLAGIAIAAPAVAQQSGGTLTGHASVGIRSVDVDGATSKFREDINLDDGVRLFDAALSYRPAAGADGLLDRLDFRADSLGGEPFESLSLTALKRGSYRLELDRTRSEYFYDDVIRPAELASITSSTGGDHHSFDFERVRDTAALDIQLSPATRLNFDLERFTREGNSVTTLDIQRDEFEIERPIDESLNAVTAGIEHRFDKVTLLFENESRSFENTSELFLPGASIGENPNDPAELFFFAADQSYDYSSRSQLLRLIARPTERLDLAASWRHEDLDLDMQAVETSAGTSFGGSPFATDDEGTSTIVRDIDLHQLNIGYSLSERIRLAGVVRQSSLAQHGQLDFADELGMSLWNIETTGAEIGIELAASEAVVISAGISDESRDVDDAHQLEDEGHFDAEKTDRAGVYVRLSARLRDGLRLNASLEDDDIDDPYALAAPSASRRYRVRLQQRWDNGLSLAGSWRDTTVDNRLSGWSGDTSQFDLRVTLDRERLSLGAGIATIDLSRDIAQWVTAGSRQDLQLIDYDAEIESRDASVRWKISDTVSIGGRAYRYDNGGSFPLRRDDDRINVVIDLSEQYALDIGFRRIDYREDRFDDFDAKLLEFALRLNW